MYARLWMRRCRKAVALLVLVLALTTLFTAPLLAQAAPATSAELAPAQAAGALSSAAAGQSLPTIWYLFAAALAMLVPAGFVLLASAGLEQNHAWNAALGGLAAAGLAAVAYWAIGFTLHFGGVGLVYPDPALSGLVLEWSPLSSEWGIGWGMAGLSGWFLSGNLTALAYSLFLANLPWVMLAALLPVMALRGRAPSTVTLLLAVLLGGVVFPLAGNWVQGGGWLNALGRNLGLGHGFVDAGGAGSVHLVAAGFALAALTVWSTRRNRQGEAVLPPAHQPLLAVVGALMLLAGAIGWLYANPLQTEAMGQLGMMRGAVALMLSAAGGLVVPLLYTWFVTGSSDPTMTARGFAAGLVAGLATTPFVQPGVALVIGLVAGATVPFVAYLLDGRLRVQDRTGVVVSSGVPAVVGLLLVGIFADGRVGAGWQQTGVGSFLGVPGQGVSGLTVAAGLQPDFPGQLQAQVIGAAALGLWGFLAGLLICVPLGLIYHSLLQRDGAPAPSPAPVPAGPAWNTAPALGIGREGAALPSAALSDTRGAAPDPGLYTVAQAGDPFAAAPYAYDRAAEQSDPPPQERYSDSGAPGEAAGASPAVAPSAWPPQSDSYRAAEAEPAPEAPPYSSAQYAGDQYTSEQYSTEQYSSGQYGSGQYGSEQYSAAPYEGGAAPRNAYDTGPYEPGPYDSSAQSPYSSTPYSDPYGDSNSDPYGDQAAPDGQPAPLDESSASPVPSADGADEQDPATADTSATGEAYTTSGANGSTNGSRSADSAPSDAPAPRPLPFNRRRRDAPPPPEGSGS
jgi:Amt family ammonium transporter